MSTTDVIDPILFRQVMGQYPTGVTVITAMGTNDQALGMVVGTFSSVSLNPPLVCFMPTRGAGAWKALQESGDRFCVNVLSESQDDTCRTIASRWSDRFEGIGYSLSPGGQPVIHGAVAYIDCVLHAIHEAGDHDIVVCRVDSLGVLSTAYPLLFFRGGYGAFEPQTLTTRDSAIREQLELVTPCRGVMEELARQSDSEVSAMLRDGDQIVLAAAAGRSTAAAVPTRVGQRLPFGPPMGSLDAAFGGPEAEEEWLSAPAGNSRPREENAATLERVRNRGYAIAFGHDAHGSVERITAQLARRDPSVTIETLQDALREFDQSYNRDIEPGESVELRYINAPVFLPDGSLAFGLTLWGPPGSVDGSQVQRHVDSALAAAARCTEILAQQGATQ